MGLESIYFMTATFTTVDYGDITPKTTYGRLFTIVNNMGRNFHGIVPSLYTELTK